MNVRGRCVCVDGVSASESAVGAVFRRVLCGVVSASKRRLASICNARRAPQRATLVRSFALENECPLCPLLTVTSSSFPEQSFRAANATHISKTSILCY